MKKMVRLEREGLRVCALPVAAASDEAAAAALLLLFLRRRSLFCISLSSVESFEIGLALAAAADVGGHAVERPSELKHIPERQRDAINALPPPYYPTVTLATLTVALGPYRYRSYPYRTLTVALASVLVLLYK